jgi:catechol-2,3-dioxygenase
MAVTRLNHAVLYVRDAERSAAFFEEYLGFVRSAAFPGGVFLRTSSETPNDHDLAVFSVGEKAGASEAGKQTVGMYHLAWEVSTLGELVGMRERMLEAGALVGESDHGVSKSLYCQDPDGLEFELMWAVPSELVTAEDEKIRTAAIDWKATVARFGAETPGRGTCLPVG